MKNIEKEQAIRLRKEGASYKFIAKQLKVAKSSVSKWCSGIELTPKQLQVLATNCRIASIISGHTTKLRWDVKRQEFLDKYVPPHNDPFFMLGLGLYWGEGTKVCSAAFTNSEPVMVKIFLRWIRDFFPECTGFTARVYHYCPQNDEETKRYWSQELGLSLRFFASSCFAISKFSERKRGNSLPYGTIKIVCRGKEVWKVRAKIEKAINMARSANG